MKDKIKWEKVVTRELSLITVFYSNLGYKMQNKELGFGFWNGLIVNKNGIIERYLDISEFNSFKLASKNTFIEHNEEGIFKKAWVLDDKLSKIIKRASKENLKKFTKSQLLQLFQEFDNLYPIYWAYYLFIFYIGVALENTPYQDRLLDYKKEIQFFRGEHSARCEGEDYFLVNFINELSGRTSIEPSLLSYALPEEIIDYLKSSKLISQSVLGLRREYYIWRMNDGKERYLTGIKAKNMVLDDINKDSTNYSKISEIRGMATSKGSVTGIAKIVLKQADTNKVEKNNILVAPMTDLKYLFAMKKAAAFVTDEGGITCHAAIVSREMGKPCVIGTKIATKVFKDGDMLEVDADKGMVKKIS